MAVTLSQSSPPTFSQFSFDREIYPLTPIPSQPTVRFPLEGINRSTAESLVPAGDSDTLTTALLIPTNNATALTVVVGGNCFGTVITPQHLLNSQLSRVFASGHIISCQLHVTPGASTLASLILPELDYAIVVNDIPQCNSTLLPGGQTWNVEPTKSTLFDDFLPYAAILFELRESNSLVEVYYKGVHCGVLEINDAAALASAVQFCLKHGQVPVARGCVRRNNGTTSVKIHALPFEAWTKKHRQIVPLRLPALLPYNADPLMYFEGVKCLAIKIEQHTNAGKATPTAWEKAIDAVPFIAMVLGGLSVASAIAVARYSTPGLVGFVAVGVVMLLISLGLLRNRREPHLHRMWEFLGPVVLIAATPPLVFSAVGAFLDTSSSMSSYAESSELTTLQNRSILPYLIEQERAQEQQRIAGGTVLASAPPHIAAGPSESASRDILGDTPTERVILATDPETGEIVKDVPVRVDNDDDSTPNHDSGSPLAPVIPSVPPRGLDPDDLIPDWSISLPTPDESSGPILANPGNGGVPILPIELIEPEPIEPTEPMEPTAPTEPTEPTGSATPVLPMPPMETVDPGTSAPNSFAPNTDSTQVGDASDTSTADTTDVASADSEPTEASD
ncbi:putative membrane protein [Corynebacterium deserti GIMN1.010]|uniref:Putative membrane protein n=1 Tax=Corynebacterium deserti GIMN1.010 TaxID=931089 RepID=A0A0M4CIR5_9CORY|nr:hypothetical protein [Corynebacterium deserti]ALC05488.1 putative membrane protein [Corynebacterium deserti GIMN1.010]